MTLPSALRGKLRLPVIGAPLFIISHPSLVIAQCKAGIVGAFPALNARPISQLDEWLHEITEALAAHDRAHPKSPAAPFAVNQIVHKSNARLEEDMALTLKWKAPIVITSLGAREDVNAAVHAYGGVTLHDIINNRFARKAVEKGADGLIAVAAGAGGHAGSTSPFALIQDIREWFDGPLLLSGAIATGRAFDLCTIWLTAKGAAGRSGWARSCAASASVISCSHSSSCEMGLALSAGKAPTIPALHWAITSAGCEIMKSGAPTTGRRSLSLRNAGSAMKPPCSFLSAKDALGRKSAIFDRLID